MRQLSFVGVLVLSGWTAQAEPVALDDATLKQAVAGKTVHLDTPFGIAVPITYQANGLMSGKAGGLESYLGAQTDRGRWWVADGRLCQKWFKWLDAQPSCMRLKQAGHRLFWRRDDGLSGTATIAATLAPGAETRPHGLGGPVDAPELREPPPSTPAGPKLASIAMPATLLPHAPKPAARKAPAIAAGDQPKSVSAHQVMLVASDTTGTEQDYRWCYASVFLDVASGITTRAGAAPDLVVIARLGYAGNEVPAPMTACLTADPALRQVAKLAIDTR